jgi:hypothetical protein
MIPRTKVNYGLRELLRSARTRENSSRWRNELIMAVADNK